MPNADWVDLQRALAVNSSRTYAYLDRKFFVNFYLGTTIATCLDYTGHEHERRFPVGHAIRSIDGSFSRRCN